ncbi:tRNA (adenosine(37)-N6)-threonylcarbamoyltransferase complex ATPase subunit type 1 TsaE [Spongiimicrobium sp. 3-5]|uniref:tRNA (adenosine(37)-N6)-threonylcarbamoyltransferase complex ATPase subunit type 1 TsaE n=1 Tax=Spongiimicrobium sp. 3-5 TaxID=3332596 RepID=UPI0039816797
MEIIFKQEEIHQVAQQIIRHCKEKLLCFYGDMGAGKTTLIKALVNELGGKDHANSPTFGIVNEYHTKKGSLLGHHFDFYRLNNEMEALDIGWEHYLDIDGWIFIEWPEKIESLLPQERSNLYLQVVDTDTRKLTLKC